MTITGPFQIDRNRSELPLIHDLIRIIDECVEHNCSIEMHINRLIELFDYL